MAYNQYGGNPFQGEEQQQAQGGGYGSYNPYAQEGTARQQGGGYQASQAQETSNPYGGPRQGGAVQAPSATYQQQQPYGARPQQGYGQEPSYAPSPIENAPYGNAATTGHDVHNAQPGLPNAGQNVQYVSSGPTVLSNSDFLSRVEAVKADIRTLTTHVSQIAAMHQRTLSSPDSGSSTQLESMITQTQVLNTSIKDQIKFLETDAARSKDNQVKNTQVKQLKSSFTKQLQEYRVEEANYEKRYREQIARQYRIVNPEATEAEVREAADADWGDEGVFQTALKTNRSATANTVLGAVRARHNDIQKIERTLVELNQLMQDLATTVVLQDEPIMATEGHTENVKKDTEAGNVQLDKGIKSAQRARKLKWWAFFIILAIIIILGLVLGLYFGLNAKK